ncbi:MAG: MFS transporter [Planctomycetota bacterium]
MDIKMYLLLSVMMFLEYAIWGAWSPVLAARLLGPLKFSGKQTGWIYGTIPIACIISTLIAGQIADKWVATELILAVAHLVGAVFLFIAARKDKFGVLFIVMLLYSLCYAATLPLVNSLMFSQLTEPKIQSPGIFIWAPVAWVLVGLMLTGWRRLAKGTGSGNDCLYFAAILSLIMGVFCFFLPHTPPPSAGEALLPFVEAFKLCSDFYFLIFIIVSFVVVAQLQFYFLGTAQYLQDIGVQSKNVPAVMTIAQTAQTLATWFLLAWLLKLGFRWTVGIGILCWLIMYLAYAATRPRWLVISSQAMHGLAYVFFVIGGQIYADSVADEAIKSSAQALLFMVTMGFGLFLGTQFTGIVMDHFRTDSKFKWRPIFLVPCVLTFLSALVFIVLFRG